MSRIEVRTRDEAWHEASRRFPTDYAQDMPATQNAGYPLYRSTADGNTSWISDLGNRLELNIMQMDGSVKSTNIWIRREPDITETRKWDAGGIMNLCMRRDWYTAGDVRSYSKMLEYVNDHNPTPNHIHWVAEDILNHTDEDGLYIEAVMYEIANNVVKVYFDVR